MEIWEVKVNELVHELENLLSWRWDAGSIRAFVEGIHNDVNRGLSWGREHTFEALHHIPIPGLPCPTVMGVIKIGENIAKWIGLSGKLD